MNTKKSLLISIKPKYVAKILNGEKTIEIRKTMPKSDLPIDVYIYTTRDKNETLFKNNKPLGEEYYDYSCISKKGNCYEIFNNDKHTKLNGKVVARFTLNKVEEIKYHFGYYDMGEWTESYILENACLTPKELDDYLKASKEYDEKKPSKVYGYAWHIDNLVIFDEPKELSEFSVRYPKGDIKFKGVKGKMLAYKQLTKAPQSWCYVEAEE